MASSVPCKTNLTDDQFAALLKESVQAGSTTRKLAAWLKATYQVEVSHNWVAKQLRDHREERRGASQAVMVEAMAPHITSDLDQLQVELLEINAVAKTLLGAKDYRGYFRAKQLVVRILDRRLHYAGAGPEQQGDAIGILDLMGLGLDGADDDQAAGDPGER